MATHDYIPQRDAEKLAWMKTFGVWLSAHGTDHGLTSQQISDYLALYVDAESKYEAHNLAKDAAQAAASAKNIGIGEAEAEARDLAQILQQNPDMTDPLRLEAGLTAPDTSPTPIAPGIIEELLPPLLRLMFAIRRQVAIHWGTNPDNERLNKRPPGTIGCEIQYCIGGIPENEDDWKHLGLDPDSPMVHHVNNDTPVTIAYRARYVGKHLKFSAYCAPIECSVSV